MKVFINNRDLLTWPRAMAEKLTTEGHEVIFIDNASTWPALLDFYTECPYHVIRLTSNVGHMAPWSGLVELPNEHYAVTDPDLDLSAVPADWADKMIAVVNRMALKCGLSLADSEIPPTNPAWEDDGFKNFPGGGHPASWGMKLPLKFPGHTVWYRATDTTFAVYAPNMPFSLEAVRIGEPYVARHIPWHVVPALVGKGHEILLDDEYIYYMQHASDSATTAKRFRAHGLLK